MKNFLLLMLAVAGLASFKISADVKVPPEVREVGSDLHRGSGKAVREVKDKSCELVNGKMDCAVKETKHAIKNGADTVEDAID